MGKLLTSSVMRSNRNRRTESVLFVFPGVRRVLYIYSDLDTLCTVDGPLCAPRRGVEMHD